MTRRLLLLPLLWLALLAGGNTARAAVYNWSNQNLVFETPDGGWVTCNTPSRFIIEWDEMVVSIQLYGKDSTAREKTYVPQHLQSMAASYNMYDTATAKYKVKGFKAYGLEGIMPDGSRAVIACLSCNKRDVIVEVTINYLLGNREVADAIIKSFAYGNDTPNRERRQQKVQSREDAKKQLEQQHLEREQQQRQQHEARKPSFDA